MATSKILSFIICLIAIKLCGNPDGDRAGVIDQVETPIDTITIIVVTPPFIADTIIEIIEIPEKHLRDQLVETFVSQIGVKQTGDNSGPEVNMYLAAVGLGPGYAWCGAFVGWGYKSYSIMIPQGAAWTPNWFTSARIIKHEEAQRGDVGGIYFNNLKRIAHIVVYEEDWNNGKNSITTIEGNTNDTGSRTGNAVHRKYRNKGQIYKSANWIDI